MMQQIQSVCGECRGQGERINPKFLCKQCNGKKVNKERKILEVNIEKGKMGFSQTNSIKLWLQREEGFEKGGGGLTRAHQSIKMVFWITYHCFMMWNYSLYQLYSCIELRSGWSWDVSSLKCSHSESGVVNIVDKIILFLKYTNVNYIVSLQIWNLGTWCKVCKCFNLCRHPWKGNIELFDIKIDSTFNKKKCKVNVPWFLTILR